MEFLTKAIMSVRLQQVFEEVRVEFLIALDADDPLPREVLDALGARATYSCGKSQAKALNAAIMDVSSEFVAFLEDDDQWEQGFLEIALRFMSTFDFLSSTQAEIDDNEEFVRVNDFPTPSGWFMKTEVLREVGYFNEDYLLHLDNEWLGRLNRLNKKRIHLVEKFAPIDFESCAQVRPWLANVLICSRGILVRHNSPSPLIRRLVHSGSGMASISANKSSNTRSLFEKNLIKTEFGSIPW